MYELALALHSLIRWVVLAAGLAAVGRALMGARRRGPWTNADEKAGFWFVAATDLQFVLGLVLYVAVSPITRLAFQDFGAAMSNSVLRFWAVEHAFGMLIAVALVHIGRARTRKAPESKRHRLAAIFFGVALVTMFLTIPWPGMPAARPLFRGF